MPKNESTTSAPIVVRPRSAAEWRRWLTKHHATVTVALVVYAKKGSGEKSLTWEESVEEALCFGWVDGVRGSVDETHFSVRFTPRKPRSRWSQINRDRAEALIIAGRMRPAGQAQVDAAMADGRWDAAYAGSRAMEVPDDLTRALRRNAKARRAFETLDRANRYAILWRIHDAKRPETRARRIEQFVEMLADGRTIHRDP